MGGRFADDVMLWEENEAMLQRIVDEFIRVQEIPNKRKLNI